MSPIPQISRRQFVAGTAAVAASAFVPQRLLGSPTPATQRVVINTAAEIAPVKPEFHGHFIEHLGSCVYGGLWVAKNPRFPTIDENGKQAAENPKELEWPFPAGRAGSLPVTY